MQSFLTKVPFFRLCLSLIMGILLFTLLPFSWWYVVVLLVLAVLCFFLHFTKYNYNFRWAFGCGTFLLLAAIGYSLSFHQKEKLRHNLPDAENLYLIELTDAPVPKNKIVMARATILSQLTDSAKIPLNIKTLLYISLDSAASRLHFGDRLVVSAQFQTPANNGNPEEFDFKAYLNGQGINSTAFVSAEKWYKAGENPNFSMRRLSSDCRDYLLNICKKYGIDGDEFAIIAAMTLGYKNALTPELRQGYSASGGVHILAVSGLHVGIMYVVLAFFFAPFLKTKRGKIVSTIAILFLLWGYAFMTGLAPSVVRSTIMFSLVSAARMFNFRAQTFNTIFFSALIMLLYNPMYLFDVGFQLSYSAVIGIVYYQSKFAAWLPVKNKFLRWAWDLTTVSMAAQLVTSPFGLYYFHKFAIYALLTNFLVIPAASVIIYGSVALYVVSPIPFIAKYVALLLNWFVKALNYSIFTIEKFPSALLSGWINVHQLLLLFGIIIFATYYFATRKHQAIFATLVSVLLFFGIAAVNTYNASVKREMVVWSNTKHATISFLEKGKCYFFSTEEEPNLLFAEAYLLKNQVKNVFYNDTCCPYYDDGFISFEGKTAYFWHSDELQKKFSDNPLQVDYLILSEQTKTRSGDFSHLFTPNLLVVSASMPYWVQKKIKENDAVPAYDVRKEGAFIFGKK